jgi:hypothetical protein
MPLTTHDPDRSSTKDANWQPRRAATSDAGQAIGQAGLVIANVSRTRM